MKTIHQQYINTPRIASLVMLAISLITAQAAEPMKLKEAKINIEHNATDNDTGFQGAIDSEGWQKLDVTGPNGLVLSFEGKGSLNGLGITELFFETVEPENAKLSIKDMLAKLPEGNYVIKGPQMINGVSGGETSGTAWLTHTIPAGPVLKAPAEGAVIKGDELTMKWGAVTKTLTGGPVKIIAYQLIVEKDGDPQPHMIGKFALSVHLPPTITSLALPQGFLEANTKYKWEVLAIEESGNQTLSSSEFETN